MLFYLEEIQALMCELTSNVRRASSIIKETQGMILERCCTCQRKLYFIVALIAMKSE